MDGTPAGVIVAEMRKLGIQGRQGGRRLWSWTATNLLCDLEQVPMNPKTSELVGQDIKLVLNQLPIKGVHPSVYPDERASSPSSDRVISHSVTLTIHVLFSLALKCQGFSAFHSLAQALFCCHREADQVPLP